jgi:predicted O-methyltransferase YrrM
MKNLQRLSIDENWLEAKKLKIQQKESEWKWFLNELSIVTDSLEIGSCEGGSTMSLSLISTNLVSIDHNPVYDEDLIKPNCNFKSINGNSSNEEVIKQVYLYFPNGVDLIFIDGDHTYDGVKKDFNNYKNLVRSNGIIAFHDIVDSKYHRSANCTVYKFWDELKTQYKYKEFREDNVWGGIGLIWMP